MVNHVHILFKLFRLYTDKNVLINLIRKLFMPYKSVSNVGSHSGDNSCIISWRNSLNLLHSNTYILFYHLDLISSNTGYSIPMEPFDI